MSTSGHIPRSKLRETLEKSIKELLPEAVKGFPQIDSCIGYMASPSAVFSRMNPEVKFSQAFIDSVSHTIVEEAISHNFIEKLRNHPDQFSEIMEEVNKMARPKTLKCVLDHCDGISEYLRYELHENNPRLRELTGHDPKPPSAQGKPPGSQINDNPQTVFASVENVGLGAKHVFSFQKNAEGKRNWAAGVLAYGGAGAVIDAGRRAILGSGEPNPETGKKQRQWTTIALEGTAGLGAIAAALKIAAKDMHFPGR